MVDKVELTNFSVKLTANGGYILNQNSELSGMMSKQYAFTNAFDLINFINTWLLGGQCVVSSSIIHGQCRDKSYPPGYGPD